MSGATANDRGRGEPRRTCIGCRQVRLKALLVRLARGPDGIVMADPHGAGRGAYVCAEAACLERATKRLAQAFRKPCVAGEDLTMIVPGGRASRRAADGREPARPRRA